ncbi:MAG: hypothetical protein MK006_14880 [Pirellulales bacterium]|nr:hypothetical protein [Pirellulales bacterium]
MRIMIRIIPSSAALLIALFCSASFNLKASELSFADSDSVNLTVPNDGVENTVQLEKGQAFEFHVAIDAPSQLPDNARLRVRWDLVESDDLANTPHVSKQDQPRAIDAFGIYTAPTASWNKLLHALDSDVFLTYRAPVTGKYRISITQENGSVDLFTQERWREKGSAPNIVKVTDSIQWPKDSTSTVTVRWHPIDLTDADEHYLIDLEPNDTPEQAQSIWLRETTDDYTLNLVGSADDIEYFDNGEVGRSGDDWYRLEFNSPEPRLFTACLSIPDQQVAARMRVYTFTQQAIDNDATKSEGGMLFGLVEYDEGKNENERNHQQEEQHRIAINRNFKPGTTYFLRVEANSPAYGLELRIVKPAPFTDPIHAVKHGLYDHIGQVDSWLTNRPRGASVERRIRDSGNLLGTNCMSCHTQSGVWGPAIPFELGYRPQNVQLFRHLINTCYQSLRPTNVLKDAANNTSLAPLDLGDGPAGTRVAGHAAVSVERTFPARKLQSKQSTRVANYVLLTADPGGINAAGPGANVGQGVVYNYSGEILFEMWQRTGDVRYFHGMEDKARKMLKITLKYCDDFGHRVEFFRRFFPSDYVASAERIAKEEGVQTEELAKTVADAKALQSKIDAQVEEDLDRLRKLQLDDGGWSFDPGVKQDDGSYTTQSKTADPSPTSTAIIAFHAAGVPKDDPTVAKGITKLLAMQKPTGMWKVASQTGFVSTSYALHALSRYFPVEQPTYVDDQFNATENESLAQTIRRVHDASVTGDPRFVSVFLNAADHDSAFVRYWAMIGLGATATGDGVDGLAKGIQDHSKMVREAAHWGFRQTLINDTGWGRIFDLAQDKNDRTRESAIRALFMEVDSVMPGSNMSLEELADVLGNAMNNDPAPAVRAWSTRASRQWWVWNPPIRKAVNQAWVKLLKRPEPNELVDNAIRYQSHALFVVNGHIANSSKEHQYKELQDLILALRDEMREAEEKDEVLYKRLSQRLVAIASTFYQTRGGDGGPGQLGYSTPFADSLFAEAVLAQLAYSEALPEDHRYGEMFKATLEGAANIPDEALQEKLVDYSINGPERFRALASASISDPRLVSLIAVPEQLEPMYAQLWRGAYEPPRRPELSAPILKMYSKVRWIIPETEEQKNEILAFIIPKLDKYKTPSEIAGLQDSQTKADAERESQAAWYIAENLGSAIGENPDMHFQNGAEAFPVGAVNNAEARYWLEQVSWILEYKRDLPEAKVDPNKVPPVDPFEQLRTRALQLFVSQLTEDADTRNRTRAADLANKTALRRNPEILVALASLVEFEKDKKVVENAKKVLSQSTDAFKKSLVAAIKEEPDHGLELDGSGNPVVPEDYYNNIVYFRDFVIPEMTKVLRGDERSCMICHGKPGRVPSLELYAPDQVGFLDTKQLLVNYRILQHRVDTEELPMSKLLRKPLNVQSVKEDGHQGGRRYQPDDPGYLIIKQWSESQVEIQRKYGLPARNKK